MEYLWDMTQNGFDRLWIYTALVGSIIWISISTYFKSTRIGLWLYAKFDLNPPLPLKDTDGHGLNSPRMLGGKSILVTKKIDELEARIRELEK